MCVPTTTAAPQLYYISGRAKQIAANFFLSSSVTRHHARLLSNIVEGSTAFMVISRSAPLAKRQIFLASRWAFDSVTNSGLKVAIYR